MADANVGRLLHGKHVIYLFWCAFTFKMLPRAVPRTLLRLDRRDFRGRPCNAIVALVVPAPLSCGHGSFQMRL